VVPRCDGYIHAKDQLHDRCAIHVGVRLVTSAADACLTLQFYVYWPPAAEEHKVPVHIDAHCGSALALPAKLTYCSKPAIVACPALTMVTVPIRCCTSSAA
jgi:hypothetical protein